MLKKVQASMLASLALFFLASTGWTQQLAGGPVPKPPTLCVNNICPSSPTSSTPTPAPAPVPSASGAPVKWHPGTYMWVGGIPGPGATQSVVDSIGSICSNANITGVQLAPYWAFLEGDNAGDYSAGFAAVDTILAKARSCNKRVMVQISERVFNTPAADPTVGYLVATYPAYLLTSAYGVCCGVLDATGTELQFGGVITGRGNGAFSGEIAIARLSDAAVMDRLIALSNAYAARYDGNPYFEMLSIGESAVPSWPGLSLPAMYDQIKRFYTAVATAWPHTMGRMVLNYTNSDPSMKDLIDACLSLSNCVVGGPDPELPATGNITRTIQANEIFRGAECSGCTPRDYRGVMAWVGEQQYLGLEDAWNQAPSAIAAYQKNTMRDSYMIWVGFSPRLSDILTQINADNSVAITACPKNFAGCNTN